MPPAEVHLLIGPPLDWSASRIACAARAAQHATWDDRLVTCSACLRLARPPCTCGPATTCCPACAQHRTRHHDATRTKALPSPRTEKQFQDAVRKLATGGGWLYYHTMDSRHSAPGFPDLVCVRGDTLLLAELKLLGKQPTLAQQVWLDALAQVTQVHSALWRPSDWDAIVAHLG